MSSRWLCALTALTAILALACGEDEPTGAAAGDGIIPTVLVAQLDTASLQSDPFTLLEATITGDTLALQVGYGGGCRDHEFRLLIARAFMESEPVQTEAALEHDSGDDPCDAFVLTWLLADLSPLKAEWRAAYQHQSGTIVLHLQVPATQAECDVTGFDQPGRCSLLYTF